MCQPNIHTAAGQWQDTPGSMGQQWAPSGVRVALGMPGSHSKRAEGTRPKPHSCARVGTQAPPADVASRSRERSLGILQMFMFSLFRRIEDNFSGSILKEMVLVIFCKLYIWDNFVSAEKTFVECSLCA